MLDLVTVARRLLETRRTVKRLEAQIAETPTLPALPAPLAHALGELHPLEQARLLTHRAALQMLAWVLEIDLDHLITPPSMRNLPEQPEHVMLHRVEMGDAETNEGSRQMWLMEIPAYTDPRDPGFSTDYWASFLNDTQAHELYEALGDLLLPQPVIPPSLTLGKLKLAARSSRSSAALTLVPPDTEDGYASVGVRRNDRRDPPSPPAAGRAAPNRPLRGA
ncbi:MAG TPA: hypothetical protein VE338_12685 [Ktedonobacterales bacterium]|jgi:hypothetical protein|nr:hypothetical protein [Ktedonobacterales bacterium]